MLHVDIDQDVSVAFHQQQHHERHLEPLEIQHAKPEQDEAQKQRSKRRNRILLFAGLLLVVVITGVITAVVVRRNESSRGE
jgi:hypothetical protein